MNIISSSYGNDSCALIQLAIERRLENVSVVFVDTGWSAPWWIDRIEKLQHWVDGAGFKPVFIKPQIGFENLMRQKKGFPNQRYQWFSMWLKALPFLEWADENDPDCKATILIGKRREESRERSNTPEFIEISERHGGRRVWHPLFDHSEEARNRLLYRAGIEPLPHRSLECSPCINANRDDFRILSEAEVQRVEVLEAEVGKTMFRQQRHGGAKGIRQVMDWANSSRGQYDSKQQNLFNQCSSGWCGT